MGWSASGDYNVITASEEHVYMGARLVGKRIYLQNWSSGQVSEFTADRLQSKGNGSNYYPYGESKTGAAGDDREQFATYTRDAGTGLDYADQRWYASGLGRFLTSDPYTTGRGGPLGRQSASNAYTYVSSSPVQRIDHAGLLDVDYSNGCGAPGTEYCIDDGNGGVIGGWPSSGNGFVPANTPTPEKTGPWLGAGLQLNLDTLAQLARAALARQPRKSVRYLELNSDCSTLKNPRTGLISRDRTYTAINQDGKRDDDITISERVTFQASGDVAYSAIQSPLSSGSGVFRDQMGPGIYQNNVNLAQYSVTSYGGDWQNVPTFVRTSAGDYSVFSIGWTRDSNNRPDVSYNGDGGLWNPDGSPRLPKCSN